MFISPVNRETHPQKYAWENITIYADNRFYAFFGTGIKSEQHPSGYPIGLDVYQSFDGVHWEEVVVDAIPIPGAHAGFGIYKIGNYFYYYPTCSDAGDDVHYKVYRTKDFQSWEHLGDSYDVRPDRSMYHERWDEMYVLADKDLQGKPIFYGYITSETREDYGAPGTGMVSSYDGIHWEVLPPIQINWGDIPSQHMELNFVEKIDNRYYLSLSGRAYMDSYGYSLYTFVGDSPFGPFSPTIEKFRLAGTTRQAVTWLGHTIPSPYGLLVALWLSFGETEIPSQVFAIGSLKRLVCENGNLRLRYWDGTNSAKGCPLPLDLTKSLIAHPTPERATHRDCNELTDTTVTLSASRDGTVLLLSEIVSQEKGFILEGNFRALENRQHIASHQQSVSVGFYLEDNPGEGVAGLADSLGVTRFGKLQYANTPLTQQDPYKNTCAQLVTGRSGPIQGTWLFETEDVVGPYGHASMCGIRHDREHTFRLLGRGNFFELFIDDLYVQTFLLPEQMTGRIGLCVVDGSCTFSHLKMYHMSFEEKEEDIASCK